MSLDILLGVHRHTPFLVCSLCFLPAWWEASASSSRLLLAVMLFDQNRPYPSGTISTNKFLCL